MATPPGIPFKRGSGKGKDPRIAKGGKRPNQTGRPPDWFKKRCTELLENNDLMKFLADVAKGKKEELHVTQFGKVFLTRAKVRDRIAAIAELADRAHGKAASSMDVTSGGKPLQPLPSIIEEARKRAQ